ncbi:MAG: tetratricopeptide repeat protein [Planctomycetaceae bacterium]|nr:tetratricopeptide repeat protein [Planctomycetaceae bacterium]
MEALDAADKLCAEAKLAFTSREMDRARQLYEQALATDSRHIHAHEGLAFVCFVVKDYQRAAELFLRVSRLDPRRAEPLINLGAAYNRLEDHAGAVRVLRQALVKDRRNADAYYNLGLAYRGQKQYGLAVSAYKEAIRLRPEMVDAHYNLGNTLIEMKSNAQAIKAFEKALEIDPQFAKARQCLERARATDQEAKAQLSPFGRLVDMDEVERRNQSPDKKYRELTANERFLERDALHTLSREAQQLATGFLGQIRDELEVALLEVSRVVSENRDTHEWHREAGQLENACDRFGQVQKTLMAKLDEIRAHEESMIQ